MDLSCMPKVGGLGRHTPMGGLGLPRPNWQDSLPAMGNIDQCGPEVCGMLPAPWSINGTAWESCGSECTVPALPAKGALWPGERPVYDLDETETKRDSETSGRNSRRPPGALGPLGLGRREAGKSVLGPPLITR